MNEVEELHEACEMMTHTALEQGVLVLVLTVVLAVVYRMFRHLRRGR